MKERYGRRACGWMRRKKQEGEAKFPVEHRRGTIWMVLLHLIKGLTPGPGHLAAP